MDVRLDGKVAIVTGAARGQGAAEAELLVESGASVVMTDVLDDAGRELAERLGDSAVFVSHDVSSVDGWKVVVESAVDRFGGIDVLVNNAGILSRKGIEEMTIDEYRRLMSINLDGAVIGTKAVIPHMRARGGGSIINICSVAGMSGSNNLAAYTMSKWALRGFTKCTALEFGPENIRANAVLPGSIETEMISGLGSKQLQSDVAKSAQAIHRVGQPEEVAQLVCYLASDLAGYVTGADFVIDGGRTAGVRHNVIPRADS